MTVLAGLEDRAHVVRSVPTGRRVEGTPLMADVTGPSFACRLAVRDRREEVGAAPGDRRVVTRARLTTGPGVDVRASDRLEVTVGREVLTYEVLTAPEPLRISPGRVVGVVFDVVRVG